MNIPKKIVDYINKAVSEAAKEAADNVKISNLLFLQFGR